MINKLYKEPRLIDKEKDKLLKIEPIKDFRYAKDITHMIIGAKETIEASKSLPVLFVKDEENNILPIVLMGIESNVCINDKGIWDKCCYIPAYIRAYPFGLTKINDNFSLVIDEAFAKKSKKGERLFSDNLELTNFGQNIVRFLENLYSDIELAKKITKMIDEVGLFDEANAIIENNGKKIEVKGFLKVNEEKLNKLKDEELLKLVKSGALNLIYLHLASITNLKKLAEKIK